MFGTQCIVLDGWAMGRCRSSLYETLTVSVPIAMLLSSGTNFVSSDTGVTITTGAVQVVNPRVSVTLLTRR